MNINLKRQKYKDKKFDVKIQNKIKQISILRKNRLKGYF